MKIITLLTDFGTSDGYVSAMKGVALSACPDACIVDASHDIPPHDIRAGAWALRHYWKLYPPETIHVAVVDPGVGSARRPLLARADGRWLVGPDNGVFSWVFREAQAFQAWSIRPAVKRTEAISATFHGRDIFAFAAGLLACGRAADALTARNITPIQFDWPTPLNTRAGIRGEIVHIDRFGNAISNLNADDLKPLGDRVSISCGQVIIDGLHRCYADAPPGQPIALFESTGLLEIAIREGNAAQKLKIGIGSAVFCQKSK